MSDGDQERAAFTYKSAEAAVAALFFLLGAIVIFDSLRLGAGWASDGPEAGYFPFYVGAIICIASLVNFIAAFANKKFAGKTFVEVGQLKLVLKVLVPSIVYGLLIGGIGPVPGLGIYVASVIFVAFFMRWLGKYAWWKVAIISIGNSVFFFFVFEIWFLVPLPKGPLERLLGLG